MPAHDVIVVGLGAVGSAATCHLARRGVDVLGIDRFSPPHPHGSSHGDTRITRLATAEGQAYVPLVRRSHELWREYEALTGRELFVQCGGLVLGVANSTSQHGIAGFVEATRSVAVGAGVAVELLDAAAIARRFEPFHVTDETGVYEPTAGYLLASSCINAQLELARAGGATLRTDERVRRWHADGSVVRVETDAATYAAKSLVLAAGPWIAELVPEIASHFEVQRQVQHWFEPNPSIAVAYERLPVYIWMHGTGLGEYFYGFPGGAARARGAKVATESTDLVVSPDQVDRTVSPAECERFRQAHVGTRLRDLGSTCIRSEVCLYTVTPDYGFVIDRHPGCDNVVVASPCSGHGFKHSAAVGEAVADLALATTPNIDVSVFSLSRFG